MGLFSSLFGDKKTQNNKVGIPAEGVVMPAVGFMLGFIGSGLAGRIKGTLRLSFSQKDKDGKRTATVSVDLEEIDGMPASLYFDLEAQSLSKIEEKWTRIAEKNKRLDNLFCNHGSFYFDYENAPRESNKWIHFESDKMILLGFKNESPQATCEKIIEEIKSIYPETNLSCNADYTVMNVFY